MKRIVKIGLITVVFTCFILSTVFIILSNNRLCKAIKLNGFSTELLKRHRPYVVVVTTLTDYQGFTYMSSVNRFAVGEEKEYLDALLGPTNKKMKEQENMSEK